MSKVEHKIKSSTTHLSHEASIRKSENKAGEESQFLTRADVANIVCFTKWGINWEIDEHKEVRNHAENKSKDDDRISSTLYSQMTKEPEENASNNFATGNNDTTESRHGLPVNSKPERENINFKQSHNLLQTYPPVKPMQVE